MSFFRFLKGIGDKLGILEVVSKPDSAPARRVQTKTISLRDLATEIRSGEVQALADAPSELSVPFETICEAAGISSKPEDWTIHRLKQVIVSEEARRKNRDDLQKAVLEILAAEKVSAEVIVKDAVARDEALDSFEKRVSEKMRLRNEACAKRLKEIESRIKDLQQESVRIGAGIRSDDEQWREWKRKKQSFEKDLASTTAYIIDRAVITTDNDKE